MSQPSFMQRLLREKILSRYLTALEDGDIDTIIAILQQSAQDAALEQMIFDLHESYQTEEELLAVMQEEYHMETRPKAVSLDNEPSKPVPSASGERRGIGRWLQTLAAEIGRAHV